MVVAKRNDDKITQLIGSVQAWTTSGNVTLNDIYMACDELEKRLAIPKKDLNGIKVEVDMNNGDMGGKTTHFYLERLNHIWHLTDVLRGDRQKHRFLMDELPERATDAIIRKYRRF